MQNLSERTVRYIIYFLCFFLNISPTNFCSAESITPPTSHNSSLQNIINNNIANGGFVYSSSEGLQEYNRYKLYTPASILKIATALAAIKILGAQYRFTTSFFQDENHNIYIKGSGDPFLTSEEISFIWSNLEKYNLRNINNVFIDNSYFRLESTSTDGALGSTNPYDALNSATSANFNTLPILKKDANSILPLEPQTPLIPLMKKYGLNLDPGKHRVSISEDTADIVSYFGELFVNLSTLNNLSDSIVIRHKIVPKGLKPFYVHYSSKTLLEIIAPLLLYSNNFIANQLFLACGAKTYGIPATWEKGKNTLESYLFKNLSINKAQFNIMEGSGLSRKNKLSPDAMLTILKHFEPYSNLLPLEDNILIKTGTLTGVYSYAGYISKGLSYYPFVIMLNQQKNTRKSILAELNKHHNFQHTE